MSKLHALSNLPKGTVLRSLTFKGTTPGSLDRLFAPRTASARDAIVDASHPWAQRHPISYTKDCPKFNHPLLNLSAFPKALLGKPDAIHLSNRYLPRHKPVKDPHVQTMSLKFSLSAKAIRHAVQRMKVKNKIKTAISLIATRGAGVNGEDVIFNEGDSKRNWILEDWTYVVQAKPELFRMSYSVLIPILRTGLGHIVERGLYLERIWNNESGKHVQQDLHPSPPNPLQKSRWFKNIEAQTNGAIELLPRKSEAVKPVLPKLAPESRPKLLSLSGAINQTPRTSKLFRGRMGNLKSSSVPTSNLNELKRALYKAPLIKPSIERRSGSP